MAWIFCPQEGIYDPRYAGHIVEVNQDINNEFYYFCKCRTCKAEFVIPKYKENNQMYIIIRDPAEKNNKYPYFQTERKVYDSLDQALTVAKKLAVEHPALKFYIAKLIKSAITEPSVSVEDC